MTDLGTPLEVATPKTPGPEQTTTAEEHDVSAPFPGLQETPMTVRLR